ncbi:uncharacterized protein [Palaemon carinicauda]|uniref:uncharacterized protein n=1 Tax=Palaemon carinicauda TaxID=392227 RepID=UPI0035B570CF
MKAVVLLAVIGLASCRITLLRDVDRDVRIKYSYEDDDFDREVEVEFDDRPRTVFREIAAPVVHHPDPVSFVEFETAPRSQFRTSVVAVEPPRPAATPVIAESAPVQVAATDSLVFTQRHVVPVAPQPSVSVQESVVPVVSVPEANVVGQYIHAEPVQVIHAEPVQVTRSVVVNPSVVIPQNPAPVAAAAPLVVPQSRPTFIAERRHFLSRSKDDSDEE